ncbi:hypothetical protein FRB90_007657 [Tulasnella sp. 427]|nr:hypothetical protein FRB90_007657 [Tulasnella sp. 427]
MGETDLLLDQFLQFIRSQPSIEILEIYPDLNANSSHPLDLLDLPKDVLPNLTKVAARVSSVLRLVPGRPVTSVILRDWLEMARVVQFAKSLAVSTASVTSVKCLMSVVAPHFFETLGRHVPNLATLDLEVAFSLRGYELASIASQIPRMQSLQSLTISGFRTARFVSLAPSPADDAILFAERFKISFPSLTEFTLVSKTGIGRSADCATCVLSDKHGWSIDEEFIVVDGDKDSKWKTCINATF